MSFPKFQTNWLILIGLVVLSLGFHSYNLEFASYDLDEAVHIWHAQRTYAEVVEQSSHDPNPPIYNLILSVWVKTFGVSEFATRFFSVLMGALGVGLMFLVASRNFGLTVGVMAALFYCFSPIQFRFTHLARPYSMLMVTVLLSYGLLLECLRKPTSLKLFLYYLATTLMIYVHPTSVFNIPAQGLIALLVHYKEPKVLGKLILPLVGSVLSFGIWVMAIPYFERDDAMWFGPPDLDAVWYVINVFYGNVYLIIGQLFLLGAIVYHLTERKTELNSKYIAAIAVWMVIPFVISIAFSHVVKPVFQDKYILSVQPAFMLMLAVCIASISKEWMRGAAFGAVVVVLCMSVNTKQQAEGDWRKAVTYLDSRHSTSSMIFIDPWYEFRTFSYYFDRHAYEVPDSTVKLIVEKGATFAWHDIYNSETGLAKVDKVHIIRAHADVNEPAVNQQLLDSVATLVEAQDFVGINVRTYEFNDFAKPKID